jgi:hypothetical protein
LQQYSKSDSEFIDSILNTQDDNSFYELSPLITNAKKSLMNLYEKEASLEGRKSFKVSKRTANNFTVVSPIYIDDNSDFETLGYSGNGTKTNPYRIENFSISISSGTAIYIQGTSSYFQIRNNYLNGLNNASIGIQLQSVRNGLIENNTIEAFFLNSIKISNSISNSVIGNVIKDNESISLFHTYQIWFVGSSMNIFENNFITNYHFDGTFSISASSNMNLIRNNIFLLKDRNKISISNSNENTLYNNTIFNVFLSNSDSNLIYGNEIYDRVQIDSSSDNNRIKINNFMNNSIAGDEGDNNEFNYNYWSGYSATDSNPADGIFDTPYSIEGSSNSIDPNPMSSKIIDFLTPPIITYPKVGDNVSNVIIIEWESSFDFLDQEITYSIYYSNYLESYWYLLSSHYTSSEISWNTTSLTNGDYQIRILATTPKNDTAMVISGGSFSIRNHFLTPITVIFPNDGDVLNGRINIVWTGGEDTIGHQVSYSIYFSTNDGFNWTLVKSGIITNQYWFDTSTYRNKTHCKVMVLATCFEGLSIHGISLGNFIISNEINPMDSLLKNLSFLLIFLIFIGIFLFLSSQMGKGVLYQIRFSSMKAGVCLGSFSEDGFIIQMKSDDCPFNEQELLYMIEYTAVMYQKGDYNLMFGPFPHNALIRSKSSEWLFISYGFQGMDETVMDPRIIKGGGIIPMILLVYYPKQFDSKFQESKEDFLNYLGNEIPTITHVKDIYSNNILKIEEHIYNIFYDR